MSDRSKFVRTRNADRRGHARCCRRGCVRGTRSAAQRYSALYCLVRPTTWRCPRPAGNHRVLSGRVGGGDRQATWPEPCVLPSVFACMGGRSLNGLGLAETRRASCLAGAVALYAVCVLAVGAAAARAASAAPLTIGQPPGAAGCVSNEPRLDPGCVPPRGLLYSPAAMVVSPDGGNLYVTSGAGPDAGAVTTFDRDELTGAIEEVGCVSANGTGGRCAVDPAVLNPSSIA